MKRLGHSPPQQYLPSLPTLDSRIVPGSQLLRTVIGFWNGMTAKGGRPFSGTEGHRSQTRTASTQPQRVSRARIRLVGLSVFFAHLQALLERIVAADAVCLDRQLLRVNVDYRLVDVPAVFRLLEQEDDPAAALRVFSHHACIDRFPVCNQLL